MEDPQNIILNDMLNRLNKSYIVSSTVDDIMIYSCPNINWCVDNDCQFAHPNRACSIVSRPKWCMWGSRDTCLRSECPYNHMTTEKGLVDHHLNDYNITKRMLWVKNNSKLVAKYYPSYNPNEKIFYQYQGRTVMKARTYG